MEQVRAFNQHNEKARQLHEMYHGREYALLTGYHAYQVRYAYRFIYRLFEGLHPEDEQQRGDSNALDKRRLIIVDAFLTKIVDKWQVSKRT